METVHVLPAAQAVAPVHPIPPHWPYTGETAPVGDALAMGAEDDAGAWVEDAGGTLEDAGALVDVAGGAVEAGATEVGALPVLLPLHVKTGGPGMM